MLEVTPLKEFLKIKIKLFHFNALQKKCKNKNETHTRKKREIIYDFGTTSGNLFIKAKCEAKCNPTECRRY